MSSRLIELHELLVVLLRDEANARQELEKQAEADALERLCLRDDLSAAGRAYFKRLRKQRGPSFRKAISEDRLFMLYRCTAADIYNERATLRCKDQRVFVNGKITYRRTPFNLAVEEIVRAGVGFDERILRAFVEGLAEDVYPKSTDATIAKSLADLHRNGFTNRLLQRLWREYPPEWCTTMRLPKLDGTEADRQASDEWTLAEPSKPAPPQLRIDEKAKLVFWGSPQLPMNSHDDFTVFVALSRANGGIVTHVELYGTIRPKQVSDKVTALKEAAPQVKEAVSHIRKALGEVRCPYRVEAVKSQGYRLRSSDE